MYAAYFLFVYVSNVSCLEPLKPSGRGHVYVGEIFSQNVRPETWMFRPSHICFMATFERSPSLTYGSSL